MKLRVSIKTTEPILQRHFKSIYFPSIYRDSKARWSDPVREGGGDVDGQPPHQEPEERRLFLQGEFCQKHGVERLHWIW